MEARARSLTGTHLCFWRVVLSEPDWEVAFSRAAAAALCAMKEAALEVTVPRMHSGGVSMCFTLFGIWSCL